MNSILDVIVVNRCNQSDEFRTVLPAKMCVHVLVIMALAAAAVLVAGAGVGAAATTWHVDDDGGAGINFTSIQQAVGNASEGDTIEVRSGTYYENVDMNRRLVLRGVDTGEGKPVVGNYNEYGWGGTPITVAVDGCTVHGFNVTGSEHGWEDVGIKIESSNNTIVNNVISFIDSVGIVLLESSNNNTISTNDIYFNDDVGIWLRDDCVDNHLIDNNVCFNRYNGIKLDGGCDNCALKGNNVSFNGDKGIDLDDDCFDSRLIDNDVCFNGDHGIELDWASFNGTLINNNASFNGGIGICIHCDNNTLYDNTVSNNTEGIYLDGVENCILRDNIINNNIYNFNVEGGGVHDIDTSNTINGKPIYYLIDQENIVIDSSWNAGYIGIVDSDRVTVRDLTMTSNGQGIIFYEVENSRIENVNVMDNIYGICLIGSSGITLKNNDAYSNEKYGILVDWGYDNSIDTSNTVNGKPAYYFYDIHDQTISNLNTTHLTIAESSNIIIEDNDVSDGDGIYLFGIEDSVISGNRVSDNFRGMVADRSDNNTFRNNAANRNKDTGMYIHWDSNNNTIANNYAYENEQHGIIIGGGKFNSIVDNYVNANKKYGIRLSHADNNTVSGNYAAFNSHAGIQVAHDSNYNKIANNNASFNDWSGIRVSSSSTNNIIVYNTLSNNKWHSIFIHDSNDNSIYHNNFMNNSNPPSDNGINNAWDNGLVDGGNYWSDHYCTGNPSAGSQPYTIGGGAGAVDRYPFESMNGWSTTSQIGDLSGDNHITPADAAIALAIAASGAQNPAADVSGDDRVTSLDALMILQAAAGNIEL